MIHQGDALEVLREMPAESVDAIVTDPPYGLTSGRNGRSPATRGAVMKGFMGLQWDGSIPSVELWAECLRVLKPGGYLLAFAGTRTQHRMAVRIEDAGFEIRDLIAWVYGSGFPKSRTVLKPAFEPITVARKNGPLFLNVEGCRIGSESRDAIVADRRLETNTFGAGLGGSRNVGTTDLGRWPANLTHDGSDEVLAAFPDAPEQMADASSSSRRRKNQNAYGTMRRGRGDEASANDPNEGAVGFKMRPGARRLDSGSAARFFYCAKASKEDRGEGNSHPTVKPFNLMRWLIRLVTPPGGVVLDPFAGSGSTGVAARAEGFGFIGIEREPAYVEMANRRIAGVAPLFNQESA